MILSSLQGKKSHIVEGDGQEYKKYCDKSNQTNPGKEDGRFQASFSEAEDENGSQ